MLSYQSISQKEDGIAIVGIGGAGANILQCFNGSSADNVSLCTMSLDERVGRACGSNMEFIQLGGGLNHGLGSGGDPEVGRMAASESIDRLQGLLKGVRLLVLVAGLGGGTGSGAAPVLAQLAREAGLFLVSVVLMPFSFEGRRRREQAEKALEEMARLSDIVYCFENDYMEELFRNRPGARAVFEEVDRLLAKATASVPMLASSPGLINLGLDELATALANNDSRCLFGSGSGYGPRRAEMAAKAAIESPLFSYHGAIRYARTVIVHIAGGDSMSLTEIRTAMELIRDSLADDEVNIFFGTSVKQHLGDEMRITLIASIDAGEFKAMEDELPTPPAEDPAVEETEEEPEEEQAMEPEEEGKEDFSYEAAGHGEPSDEEEPEPEVEETMEEPMEEAGEGAQEEWEEAPTELPEEELPRDASSLKQASLLIEEDNPLLRQGDLLQESKSEPEDVKAKLRSLFPEDEPYYSPSTDSKGQSAGGRQEPSSHGIGGTREASRQAGNGDHPLRFNDLRTFFPKK